MRNSLAALLGAVLLGACHGAKAPQREPAEAAGLRETTIMEWNGPFSSVTKPETRVITKPAEWTKLWADVGAPEAPVADLQVYMAVAVFLGERTTGGYSVKLLDPVSRGGATVIPFRENVPRGITFQAITYPYAVKLYPKLGTAVTVEPEQKQ